MAWLRALIRRSKADSEIDKELSFHIDRQVEDYVRVGMSPHDATRRAKREFGGFQQVKEECREVFIVRWWVDLVRDVRLALRHCCSSPGFVVVVVATLGLGIGATTAIFSVVNTLLLKPLPYPGAERLVQLVMTLAAVDVPAGTPARQSPGFLALEADLIRTRIRSLSDVGTIGPDFLGLVGHEEARLQGARISAGALRMLSARPLLGRIFDPADERPDAEPVVILSFSSWQRYFAGDPSILGRNLSFESVLGPRRQLRYAVVGVMPAGFEFPRSQLQFWTPFPAAAQNIRGPLLARLADGATPESAMAELLPLVREIRRGRQGNASAAYELVRTQDELVKPVRPALLVLTAAVGFVLLIACINVANLLLARMASRQREIATRSALGAGRGRLARLLLTESLLLAAMGGTLGVGIAVGGIHLLKMLAPTLSRLDMDAGQGSAFEFPRLNEIGVDAWTLAFAAAVSLVAVGVFGLAPAIRSSRSAAHPVLRDGTRGSVAGFAGLHLRQVLVVMEIAATMVLLVGGGLLIRSFLNLSAVDTGYNAANVLTFQISVPLDKYSDARLKTFAEELVDRLKTVPAIQSAGYANQLPFVQLFDSAGGLWKTPDANRQPSPGILDARLVSRGYLTAMGIRVVAGRGFEERDGTGQPRVLIINESEARKDFPNQDPVGQLVYVGRDPVPWQIVGIVGDVRQFSIEQAPDPQLFGDIRQWDRGMPIFPIGAYYVARTTGNPEEIVPALRNVVRQLEPTAALFNVAPMERLVATTVARPRMYAVLLGLFAAVAVILAVVGVSGVVAYAVTQRTREIGIRMALGARRVNVVGLVFRQNIVLTATGILIGTLGATVLTRYLDGMLFGLTASDPQTFIAVAALFAAVATLAAYVPARRATKVDPLVALRTE